jgi:hypothetical protein
MRAESCTVGIALLVMASSSYPQDALVGTYKGLYAFTWQGSAEVTVHTTLEIGSAKEGKVSGKFTILSGQCRGDYALQGTYEGNSLALRTSKGKMDCGDQPLTLAHDGKKMKGKFGSYDIEFSR